MYRARRRVSVLNTKVLVLNRSYLPVHVTVVRRALSLLYQGIAQAVDDELRTFDFASWADLAADEDSIGTVDKAIRVPRVILLQYYDRVPRRYVRFSRFNIYARDQNRCQYCGRQFPRAELNLDHVVPLSRGGRTSWDNVVCCCFACNHRKGNRLPHETGMRLIQVPVKPKWHPLLRLALAHGTHAAWKNFLDVAYWNIELETD